MKRSSGRLFSTSKSNTEVLREANQKMKEYYHARNMLRRGELKPHPSNKKALEAYAAASNPRNTNTTTTYAQAAILLSFVAAFLATPLLGKKIATDHAFRQQYIPAWLDFTVEQPKDAWTRDELHAQMLAVQQHVMTRAAQGEFAPEQLQALQQKMEQQSPEEERQKVWDRIHPGLEEGDDDDDEE